MRQGYVFTGICESVHMGCVSLHALGQTAPLGRHPPGRHPPTATAANSFHKQESIPVGCIPPTCCPYLRACTARGVYLVPGGVCLVLGGVLGLRGVYLVPGGTCPGDVLVLWGYRPGGCTWSWGMYLPRGHLVLGGYLPKGMYLVPDPGTPPPCEQND